MSRWVNLEAVVLFFFFLSLHKAERDTAHFVLVIFPFARDIRQKAVCNGVPVEAANMALLWGRSYRADNVMDHCLDRRTGGVGGKWRGVKTEEDAEGRQKRRVVLREE